MRQTVTASLQPPEHHFCHETQHCKSNHTVRMIVHPIRPPANLPSTATVYPRSAYGLSMDAGGLLGLPTWQVIALAVVVLGGAGYYYMKRKKAGAPPDEEPPAEEPPAEEPPAEEPPEEEPPAEEPPAEEKQMNFPEDGYPDGDCGAKIHKAETVYACPRGLAVKW